MASTVKALKTARGLVSDKAGNPDVKAPLLPLILIMAGAYLIWFGVSYWEDTKTIWPSDPVKALLTGGSLPPRSQDTTAAELLSQSEATVQEQVSSGGGGGGGGQGGGHGGGGSAVAPASGSERDWILALLKSIHAPATPANIESMTNWVQHESVFPGGPNRGGLWNPLNTTQSEPGDSTYNSVGVRNYPSEQEGLRATVQTLNNGNYNDILLQLRAGHGLRSGASAGLLKWSGNGYSSV